MGSDEVEAQCAKLAWDGFFGLFVFVWFSNYYAHGQDLNDLFVYGLKAITQLVSGLPVQQASLRNTYVLRLTLRK